MNDKDFKCPECFSGCFGADTNMTEDTSTWIVTCQSSDDRVVSRIRRELEMGPCKYTAKYDDPAHWVAKKTK